MAKKYLSAEKIVQLLKDQNLIGHVGGIKFELMGISIDINDKSTIGYLFQEWLSSWMEKNDIYFRVKPNSQEFPDFLLDPDSDKIKLLEVKVFDADAGPNFDVANFEAYCRSLKTNAYRVDADYLIFAYTLRDAKLQITNFWLKKIWDITGPSGSYGIKTQTKQGMIYNIRPIIWYTLKARFKAFGDKESFLNALHSTLTTYEHTAPHSINWLRDVNENYLGSNPPKLIK
jgi:type II restriction enzyme